MRSTKTLLKSLGAAVALSLSSATLAGPVIIGGDDLTDHGNNFGGNNNLGWLYIEKAIANLNTNQTRGGTLTVDIAALGSSPSGASGGNAGAAIGSAAAASGLSVSYYDGATAINQFFTDLAAGTVNPALLWIAGTGAANDLVGTEGIALTNNAAAINTFVGSGGGLLAHGSGTTAFGWLSALLPGLNFPGGCQANGATLTADGQAAFPGLSNADISSGPCHNTFTGNFGGLTVLANDGQNRPFIIGSSGAGGGSITDPPTAVAEPASLFIMGLGLLGLGFARRRRS